MLLAGSLLDLHHGVPVDPVDSRDVFLDADIVVADADAP